VVAAGLRSALGSLSRCLTCPVSFRSLFSFHSPMAAPESAPPPAAPSGPAAAAASDAAEASSPAAADSSSTVPAASNASAAAAPATAEAASGLNAAPLLIDASINDELPPLDDPDLDALRDEVYGQLMRLRSVTAVTRSALSYRGSLTFLASLPYPQI
jgi:hypothetical protein